MKQLPSGSFRLTGRHTFLIPVLATFVVAGVAAQFCLAQVHDIIASPSLKAAAGAALGIQQAQKLCDQANAGSVKAMDEAADVLCNGSAKSRMAVAKVFQAGCTNVSLLVPLAVLLDRSEGATILVGNEALVASPSLVASQIMRAILGSAPQLSAAVRSSAQKPSVGVALERQRQEVRLWWSENSQHIVSKRYSECSALTRLITP